MKNFKNDFFIINGAKYDNFKETEDSTIMDVSSMRRDKDNCLSSPYIYRVDKQLTIKKKFKTLNQLYNYITKRNN